VVPGPPVQIMGAAAPSGPDVPLQRTIRGGRKGVLIGLEKHAAWKKFTQGKSKTAVKYNATLDEMLTTVDGWDTGVDAGDVVEAIRVNSFDPAGLLTAQRSLLSEIESFIDDQVLSQGHSGERHYAKDEQFQRARMAKEKKGRTTSLEDSKATKQFFTRLKDSVLYDLAVTAGDLLADLAELSEGYTLSVGAAKAVIANHVGDDEDFDDYTITLEKISAKGAPGGQVQVKVSPKLESSALYPKVVYTSGKSDERDETIVMYWGGQSPIVVLANGDDMTAVSHKFDAASKAPVTAY